MFLHIGENKLLPVEDIVAIFDLKKLNPNNNQTYVKWRISQQDLENLETFKSLVLTTNDYYLSSLSSQILMRRAGKEIIA